MARRSFTTKINKCVDEAANRREAHGKALAKDARYKQDGDSALIPRKELRNAVLTPVRVLGQLEKAIWPLYRWQAVGRREPWGVDPPGEQS
ncbi:hypothetical protein AYO71_10005 [Pseudomonas koreensis]|nr:hypothetical protein AYO71_10005 [Pseudomonas koreensis]